MNTILSEELKTIQYLNDVIDYDSDICGLFYFGDTIKTNLQFIECLSSCLFWQIDTLPKMLIDYSLKANYSLNSLINDINIIKEYIVKIKDVDTDICDQLIDNLTNTEHNYKLDKNQVDELNEIDEFTDQFNYINKLFNLNVTKIEFDEEEAIDGLIIISVLIKYDIYIPESVFDYYCCKNYGSIISKIYLSNTDNYNLDFTPNDLDSYNLIKEYKTNVDKFFDEHIFSLETIDDLDYYHSISYLLFLSDMTRINGFNIRLEILKNNKLYLFIQLYILYLLDNNYNLGTIYFHLLQNNDDKRLKIIYNSIYEKYY